jgi:hypothetical protein
MKKIIITQIFVIVSVLFISCNTDDKFTGSPVDNLEIISLKGVVSTPVTSALSGQEIDVKVELPVGKTFLDTVVVEVSSYAKSGGRTKANVEIMPGQTSGVGKISAVGGSIFNTTFDLKLTAINLQTVEEGKHYLISSDSVQIETGDSTVPGTNSKALIMRLVWPYPSITNNLKYNINKPGTLPDINVLTLNEYGKVHTINNTGSTNNSNISSAEGEYIISITADGVLVNEPKDMPYRMILVHPNGKLEVFEGVYEGLSSVSPLKPILKVTKEVIDGEVRYSATDVF